jgi:hypothetical protein
MPALGLGIGIPFRRMGAGIDAQAQAHYNRVIADGGLIPSGLVGVNNFFTTVKGIYGTSDITTAISVGLDAQVLGYKLGAGAGTTAGQAAQKLYSCSGASGDVVQTTAASQPLLLVHSGANYWFGSGVSGNNVTTTATISPSTQVDLILYLVSGASNSGASAFANVLISNDGAARNFVLNFSDLANGIIRLRCGTPFSEFDSTVGIGNTSNYTGWIRATYNQNGLNGDVVFYTSSNSVNTAINSISWTQLGATVTKVSSGLQVGVSSLQVGSTQGISNYLGKIARATISTTIGGAPVVDFNPNQYNAANSQTQWVSTSGETWSLNVGTATSGYKGALVTKTIIQGDGVDDLMQSGTIASQSICTNYLSVNPLNLNIAKYYLGSSVADGNIIYNVIGNTRFGNASPYNEIIFSNVLDNRLSLLTAVGNASSSLVFTNNANQVSGTVGSASFSNVRLFAPSSAALFGNGIINTFILAKQADNSTNRTAVYNFIRSINGSAF